MKIKRIIPCTCIKYKPAPRVSSYYGMPVLSVCAYDRGDRVFNYYEAFCPRCGNSQTGRQYKSAYTALMGWNKWMEELWEMRDPLTGEKLHDFDSLPSLMDGDGYPWSEPQESINKELQEWRG